MGVVGILNNFYMFNNINRNLNSNTPTVSTANSSDIEISKIDSGWSKQKFLEDTHKEQEKTEHPNQTCGIPKGVIMHSSVK